MSPKKVLIVASNYGFWAEEVQAPWDALKQAGVAVIMGTPQGKKPLPLAISVDPDFVDPIQKYKVNTPEACRRTKELVAGGAWERTLRLADARTADYDALVLCGGLGADIDLANNPALHALVLDAYRSGKLVAAICFSVAALLFTRDPANGFRSVVHGRRITAHPRAWDFKADVSYDLYGATPENAGTNVVTPGFLLPLQDIAIDAVGAAGTVLSDPATSRAKPSVVHDGPFITGCSVESSQAFARKVVEVLSAS
jgi:putative intracellular protease/amidase